MANERKTETIVRDTLGTLGYFADKTITIEEQRSDNPRIQKLLKSASKSGKAGGSPEFIISCSRYPDLLIVVECKASASHHESPARDKFADYAVDGALLYASYLSKDYDVIAIGVSGQTKATINISHYLLLKGAATPVQVFGKGLLPLEDYYAGYIVSV
jgi:hypothetical protein